MDVPRNSSQGQTVVDPTGAVITGPQQSNPPPTPLAYLESESEASLTDPEKNGLDNPEIRKVQTTVSSREDGSGSDSISATENKAQKKKWYKRLNPLKLKGARSLQCRRKGQYRENTERHSSAV